MTGLSLLLCLTLTGSLPVEAPRPTLPVRLMHRFQPGETLRYQVEQTNRMHAVKGMLVERTASQAVSEQQFTVVSVAEDGAATLRLTVVSARMQARFNDEEPLIFDSAANDAPSRHYQTVSQAIGRPLAEVTVRPDGRVISAKELWNPNGAVAPGSTMAGSTAEESSGWLDLFPNHAVVPGEEWTDVLKAKVTVPPRLRREVSLLRTYRLDRVQDGIAEVSFRVTLLTPVNDPQQLVQLIGRQYAGTLRFDIAAGRLLSRQHSSDNTELGWAEADSSLRAIGKRVESLLAPIPVENAAADRQAAGS